MGDYLGFTQASSGSGSFVAPAPNVGTGSGSATNIVTEPKPLPESPAGGNSSPSGISAPISVTMPLPSSGGSTTQPVNPADQRITPENSGGFGGGGFGGGFSWGEDEEQVDETTNEAAAKAPIGKQLKALLGIAAIIGVIYYFSKTPTK